MEGRSELPWVNWMKFICMLLVYLNHSEIFYGCKLGWVGDLYRPVFVNAFFFISGYLLFRKQWSTKLLSLGRKEWYNSMGGGKSLILSVLYKIYIPTVLIWGIRYVAMAITGGSFSMARFAEIVIGGDAAWFTIALAGAELIVALILLLRIRRKWVYLLIAGFLWGASEFMRSKGVAVRGIEYFPWYYKSAMEAVLFMVLGGLFAQVEYRTGKRNSTVVVPLIISVAYILFALLHFAQPRTALDHQGLNVYGLALSLLGIAAMIGLTKRISSVGIVNWIGRHTIGLYFFSAIILKGVCPIAKHFIAVQNYCFTIACALIAFTIGIGVVYVLNRWLPFVFDLRLLKRKNSYNK